MKNVTKALGVALTIGLAIAPLANCSGGGGGGGGTGAGPVSPPPSPPASPPPPPPPPTVPPASPPPSPPPPPPPPAAAGFSTSGGRIEADGTYVGTFKGPAIVTDLDQGTLTGHYPAPSSGQPNDFSITFGSITIDASGQEVTFDPDVHATTTELLFDDKVEATRISFVDADDREQSVTLFDFTPGSEEIDYEAFANYQVTTADGQVTLIGFVAFGADDTMPVRTAGVGYYDVSVVGYYYTNDTGVSATNRFYGEGRVTVDFGLGVMNGEITDLDFNHLNSADPLEIHETATDGADFGFDVGGTVTGSEIDGFVNAVNGNLTYSGTMYGDFYGPGPGGRPSFAGVYEIPYIDLADTGSIRGVIRGVTGDAPVGEILAQSTTGGTIDEFGSYVGTFRGPAVETDLETNTTTYNYAPSSGLPSEVGLDLESGGYYFGTITLDANGETVTFDPDVHESTTEFLFDDRVRTTRIAFEDANQQERSITLIDLAHGNEYASLASYQIMDADGSLSLIGFLSFGADDTVPLRTTGSGWYDIGIIGYYFSDGADGPITDRFYGEAKVHVDFDAGTLSVTITDVDFNHMRAADPLAVVEAASDGNDFGLQITAAVTGTEFQGSIATINATGTSLTGPLIGDFYGPDGGMNGGRPNAIAGIYQMTGPNFAGGDPGAFGVFTGDRGQPPPPVFGRSSSGGTITTSNRYRGDFRGPFVAMSDGAPPQLTNTTVAGAPNDVSVHVGPQGIVQLTISGDTSFFFSSIEGVNPTPLTGLTGYLSYRSDQDGNIHVGGVLDPGLDDFQTKYSSIYSYSVFRPDGSPIFLGLITIGGDDTPQPSAGSASYFSMMTGYYLTGDPSDPEIERFTAQGSVLVAFDTGDIVGEFPDAYFAPLDDPTQITSAASDGTDFGVTFSGSIASPASLTATADSLSGGVVMSGPFELNFYGPPQANPLVPAPPQVAGVFNMSGNAAAFGAFKGIISPELIQRLGFNESGGLLWPEPSGGVQGEFRGPSVVSENSTLVVNPTSTAGSPDDVLVSIAYDVNAPLQTVTISLGGDAVDFDFLQAATGDIADPFVAQDRLFVDTVTQTAGADQVSASRFQFNFADGVNVSRKPEFVQTYGFSQSTGGGPPELIGFTTFGANSGVAMPQFGQAQFDTGVFGQFTNAAGTDGGFFVSRGPVTVSWATGDVTGQFNTVYFDNGSGTFMGGTAGGSDFSLRFDGQVVGDDFFATMEAFDPNAPGVALMDGDLYGEFFGPGSSTPVEIGGAFGIDGAYGTAIGALQGRDASLVD